MKAGSNRPGRGRPTQKEHSDPWFGSGRYERARELMNQFLFWDDSGSHGRVPKPAYFELVSLLYYLRSKPPKKKTDLCNENLKLDWTSFSAFGNFLTVMGMLNMMHQHYMVDKTDPLDRRTASVKGLMGIDATMTETLKSALFNPQVLHSLNLIESLRYEASYIINGHMAPQSPGRVFAVLESLVSVVSTDLVPVLEQLKQEYPHTLRLNPLTESQRIYVKCFYEHAVNREKQDLLAFKFCKDRSTIAQGISEVRTFITQCHKWYLGNQSGGSRIWFASEAYIDWYIEMLLKLRNPDEKYTPRHLYMDYQQERLEKSRIFSNMNPSLFS